MNSKDVEACLMKIFRIFIVFLLPIDISYHSAFDIIDGYGRVSLQSQDMTCDYDFVI